jgi:hypothetical protein
MSRAISAGTVKIPDPSMTPTAIIVESSRLKPRTKVFSGRAPVMAQ